MNINNFQSITFDNANEQSRKDFHSFIDILLNNDYEFIVREEDTSIVTIEYNYNRYLGYGNPVPLWVDENNEICGE